MPGIADRILGQNIMEEADKKIQSIKDSLVPLMERQIIEQKHTNELLSSILKELQRKKK